MHILLLNAFFCGCLGLILNSTRGPEVKYYHVTADFGVRLSSSLYETTAPLIAIDPIYGCGSITNGEDLRGAIVLVRRGGCSFFLKAQYVASFGGVGLVVGNNEDGDELLQMHKSTDERRDVDIPCVFITENDYNKVSNEVRNLPAGTIQATISKEWEYPIDGFWSTSGLTTIVTYMLIICPSLWVLISAVQFCRRVVAHRRRVRRRSRVIPEVLFSSKLLEDALPNSSHITNASCPICLENFEEDIRIKLLPCDHGFHKECIEPWIADHKDSCPICRQTVLDKLEEVKNEKICCCCRPRIGGYNQRLLSSQSESEQQEPPELSLQVEEEKLENADQELSEEEGSPQRILHEPHTADEEAAEPSVDPEEPITSGAVIVLPILSE